MTKKRIILAVAAFCAIAMTAIFAPTLNANEVRVEIDGVAVEFEVQPFIYEGRTMVPIRAIAEMLDIDVQWHPESRMVTYFNIHGEVLLYELTIGQHYALEIDAAGFVYEIELDVPPMIVDDRTFVPLRFIAESLDVLVDFVDGTVFLSTENWPEPIVFYSVIRPAQPADDIDLHQTVWIAGTGGSIYHSVNNCGNMNPDNATSMTREEAWDRDIRACLRCW